MSSKMSLFFLLVTLLSLQAVVSANNLEAAKNFLASSVKKAKSFRSTECSDACLCAGYYLLSGTCTACSGGTWSDIVGITAATSCYACPENYACSAGAKTQCTTSSGSYAAVGSSVCSTCKDGYINGASQCEACPTTQWSTDHITCTACAAGYACYGNGNRVACVAGSYAVAGSDRCTPCGNGFIGLSASLSKCTSCPGGQTSFYPFQVCYDCPSGYACETNGVAIRCTEGSYAATGSSDCYACAAGTYSSEVGVSACSPCATNTYSTGGATSCTACATGQTSGSGSSECTGTAITSPPATSPVTQSSSGSSGGGANMGAAIGAAIAVALVVICCAFFGYRWYHKRGAPRSGTFKNWGDNQNALNSEY